MKKYRLLWDKTEEMNWLNDLAKQGWNLTSFGLGLYSFERCQPGEYVYEADLKDKGIRISRAYREILESQNIEIIPTVGYWFLVRRKAALGPLELYSDTPSQISQYRRIRRMFGAVAALELLFSAFVLLCRHPCQPCMDGTGGFVLALLGIVLLNAFCQTDRKIRSLEDAPQSADPVRKLLAAGGVLLGCSVLLHPQSACLPPVAHGLSRHDSRRIRSVCHLETENSLNPVPEGGKPNDSRISECFLPWILLAPFVAVSCSLMFRRHR